MYFNENDKTRKIHYDGGLIDGFKSGFGKAVYSIDIIYEGEWLNDVKEGKGFISFENGLSYNGQWSQDTATGKGELIDSNAKEKYVGDFFNGFPHGFGEQFLNNNEHIFGKYKNGQLEEEFAHNYF